MVALPTLAIQVAGTRQSLILLPKVPMRPRNDDARVGFFLVDRVNYGRDEQKAVSQEFVARWRLELKDPAAYWRGELVEPIKPIVYDIDPGQANPLEALTANAYPLTECLADVKRAVWSTGPIDGNRRVLQRVYLARLEALLSPSQPAPAAAPSTRAPSRPTPFVTTPNLQPSDLPSLVRMQLRNIQRKRVRRQPLRHQPPLKLTGMTLPAESQKFSFRKSLRNVRALSAMLCATFVIACASSGGTATTTKRVAPNNQTILLDQQTDLGLSKARVYYVRNGSTVPIVITEISILDCLNLKQFCGVNTRNIRVDPGQRKEIIRMEPQDLAKAFNYRLQWRWRGAPVAAKPPAPDDTAGMRRAALMAQLEQFRLEEAQYGDKILNPNTLSAIGDNFASLRAEPDTVRIAVGARLYIFEQLRVLAIDKAGKVMGRVRASMQWTVARSPAIRFLSPDTLQADAPGTTTVTMRLNSMTLLDTLRAKTMPPVVFTIIAK